MLVMIKVNALKNYRDYYVGKDLRNSVITNKGQLNTILDTIHKFSCSR
jgi:hypothetical protein